MSVYPSYIRLSIHLSVFQYAKPIKLKKKKNNLSNKAIKVYLDKLGFSSQSLKTVLWLHKLFHFHSTSFKSKSQLYILFSTSIKNSKTFSFNVWVPCNPVNLFLLFLQVWSLHRDREGEITCSDFPWFCFPDGYRYFLVEWDGW